MDVKTSKLFMYIASNSNLLAEIENKHFLFTADSL